MTPPWPARLLVSSGELDYWRGDIPEGAPEVLRKQFQAATTRRRIMAELAESRELVAGHHLDFPGIGYVAEDEDGFRFLPHVWSPSV
ncbi:MAG: hypothetical protein R6W87_13505 [Halospina sp.]